MHILKTETFLETAAAGPAIIDVRSPGEFSQGHIPNAINIPLFVDEERREIGKLYNQVGHDAAVLRGLELAVPRIPWYLDQCQRVTRDNQVVVHCWRGGLRSNCFARLCAEAGMNAWLLEGGYKAYRRLIRQRFAECAQLVVLGGMTGCGKTEVLRELAELGEQIVDLEGLARHKGSAFGSIGQDGVQPTNEQFENDTAAAWQELDRSRRIWIEDESRRIGKVFINEVLFEKMQRAVICSIEVPEVVRTARLERDYGNFPIPDLTQEVYKIQKRLGLQRTRIVVRHLEQENLIDAIEILLKYYDQGYRHGSRKRKTVPHNLKFGQEDSAPPKIAETLVQYVARNFTCRQLFRRSDSPWPELQV